MAWVKFHEEITMGAKRGIPRALRFVLLELSLKARPLAGRIELPVGMADIDAVHDLLGGDLQEIKAALDRFTAGKEPVLFFEDEGECRYLVIPTWAKWNSVGEPAGASTERSRRSRANHRAATVDATERNSDATTVACTAQRPSNASATPPRVEEIRVEEKREEIPSESVVSRPNARPHEEQTSSQSTHTQGTDSEVERSELPPLPDADWLAGEFAKFPAIARFSTDENLVMDLAGGLQTKPHTREQASLIVSDFVTKSGGEARTMDRATFQRAFGGYVTSSRLRQRSTTTQTEIPTGEVREALDLFAASWRASQGRERVPDTSDPQDAATCLALAKEAAKGTDTRAMKVFEKAVEAYLADSASWLKDAQWPLRMLAKKFSSYARAPTAKPKPGPAKAPEEPQFTRTTRRAPLQGNAFGADVVPIGLMKRENSA